MRVSAILCKAIFVIGRVYPDRGGVEVTGQTASMLAKAAPSLQHHSSIGSWSLAMTIFHCFLFFRLVHVRQTWQGRNLQHRNCIPFVLQLYTFCAATVYLLRGNCTPFALQLYTFCVATVYLLRSKRVTSAITDQNVVRHIGNMLAKDQILFCD